MSELNNNDKKPEMQEPPQSDTNTKADVRPQQNHDDKKPSTAGVRSSGTEMKPKLGDMSKPAAPPRPEGPHAGAPRGDSASAGNASSQRADRQTPPVAAKPEGPPASPGRLAQAANQIKEGASRVTDRAKERITNAGSAAADKVRSTAKEVANDIRLGATNAKAGVGLAKEQAKERVVQAGSTAKEAVEKVGPAVKKGAVIGVATLTLGISQHEAALSDDRNTPIDGSHHELVMKANVSVNESATKVSQMTKPEASSEPETVGSVNDEAAQAPDNKQKEEEENSPKDLEEKTLEGLGEVASKNEEENRREAEAKELREGDERTKRLGAAHGDPPEGWKPPHDNNTANSDDGHLAVDGSDDPPANPGRLAHTMDQIKEGAGHLKDVAQQVSSAATEWVKTRAREHGMDSEAGVLNIGEITTGTSQFRDQVDAAKTDTAASSATDIHSVRKIVSEAEFKEILRKGSDFFANDEAEIVSRFKSFDGEITMRIAPEGEKWWRYSDSTVGEDGKEGSFLTKAEFETPPEAIEAMAIKSDLYLSHEQRKIIDEKETWKNKNFAIGRQEVIAKEPVLVLEGRIANGVPPGTIQTFIIDRSKLNFGDAHSYWPGMERPTH